MGICFHMAFVQKGEGCAKILYQRGKKSPDSMTEFLGVCCLTFFGGGVLFPHPAFPSFSKSVIHPVNNQSTSTCSSHLWENSKRHWIVDLSSP